MPTFENGWICRECWCANREHDVRCYRCHADRPGYLAPGLAPPRPTPADPQPAPEPAPLSASVAPAADDAAAEPAAATLAQRTHFCFSCGQPLLPGAAFCTQCGTPASEQEIPAATTPPRAAQPVAAAAVAADPSEGRKASPARRPRQTVRLTMPPLGAWVQALRAWYVAYVHRNTVVWELSMAGLALAFVAIGFLAARIDGALEDALLTLGWLVTIVFVVEFASRLAAASDRRGHVRSHWIDLLALVPIMRAARVLSLLRLVPMVPGFARVSDAIRHVPRTLRHHAQLWLFVAWLALMIACSLFLYGYAVSSSSGVGRLAGGVLLIMGLALFSAVTAALTSFLLRARRDPTTEVSEQLRALGALREAGLVTSDEYGTQRAAIMHSLTPHERGQSAS